MNKYRKRIGDRYDGRSLKKVDSFYKIIPYIMKTRVDSQVYFEDKIYLQNIEEYIKYLRKNEKINVRFLHLVIAAMVRTISQKPRINRFVSGRKIYARNEISISLAVKKAMNENAPETTIKVIFDPTDTLFDVVEKVNNAIAENNDVNEDNETDKLAKIIMFCPGVVIRILVGVLNYLDQYGRLPKIINRLSPFHTSLFVTNLGSLGIKPVYHHIYEFGTTSLFIAFGSKNKERVLDKEGNVSEQKYIDMKVVADERICDGFYFSSAFKAFRRLIENPERIAVVPKQVYEDDGI